MPKQKQYCTLEPVFPANAFLLFLFILHKDDLLGVVPLDAIYQTPEEAAGGVQEAVKQFEASGKTITVPEECLLLPIKLDVLYPLRKEFWANPTFAYNPQLRMKTFAPVIDYPEFYSLLATPYAFDVKAKKWYIHAALPLIDKNDTSAIEQFMFNSDHVVEPKAKSAAIYTITGKMKYNWKTKEIQEIKSPASKLMDKGN